MNNKGLSQCVGNVGNAQILQTLRSAPLVGVSVGNVGNIYRFPTFLRPPLPGISCDGKAA